MRRRVLDVGNCAADHAALAQLVSAHFSADVVQTHGPEEALEALRRDSFDLVLVNRRLDQDGSDGLTIIEAIKSDMQLAKTPVMMITNYADHQQRAVAAGAEPGFGKSELDDPQTLQRLRPFLA